jgi:hypothetical protein
MNDNMSSAPQPSMQQPVSMHDTPHKHHGALPLIAAMLGVFLVIETVVLGYVVKEFVLDEQEEAVVAEETESETEVTEELEEDTLFSHLVVNGEERVIQGQEDATYLYGLVNDRFDRSGCAAPSQLVDESQRSEYGFGIGSEGLADPDVVAAFSNRVTSGTALSVLGQVLDNQDQILFQICEGKSEDYVILLDSTGTVATLADYDDEHNYWNLYQPIREVMDGAVWLMPDFFATNEPILFNGYGDAGNVWWRYWVPTKAGSTQLIEDCLARPNYYVENGVSKEGEGRLLSCEVEYVE